MKVKSQKSLVRTNGENDVVDVTDMVASSVSDSGMSEGTATVFVVGSTAAVTTLEFEPGLVKDLPAMLERVSPKGARYEHQKTWSDNNGHSHIRAALIGPSLCVPFNKGALSLGVWQQIVLIELDVRPRERTIVIQVIGE
jgi:secondary thiamine-phosphate synthase enzyme